MMSVCWLLNQPVPLVKIKTIHGTCSKLCTNWVKRSCDLSPVSREMLPVIKLRETAGKKSLSTLPMFEFVWSLRGKWDPLTSGGKALTANWEKLIDKVQNMRARARDRNLCGLRATAAENKKEVEEARRRSALAVGFVRLGRWSGSIEPRKTNNSQIRATASDLRGLAGSTASGEGRCSLWWRHGGLKTSGWSLMSMNAQRLTELQARHQQTHSGGRQADETAGKRAGGKIREEDERTELGLDTTSSSQQCFFQSPTIKICSWGKEKEKSQFMAPVD